MFSGDQKEYGEFATKLRSQIAASKEKVYRMMKAVENLCSEDRLVKGKYD
jgi:hypothetical protein